MPKQPNLGLEKAWGILPVTSGQREGYLRLRFPSPSLWPGVRPEGEAQPASTRSLHAALQRKCPPRRAQGWWAVVCDQRSLAEACQPRGRWKNKRSWQDYPGHLTPPSPGRKSCRCQHRCMTDAREDRHETLHPTRVRTDGTSGGQMGRCLSRHACSSTLLHCLAQVCSRSHLSPACQALSSHY